MRFGAPEYAYLFWILPVVVGVLIHSFVRKKAAIKEFCGEGMFPRLVVGGSPREVAKDVLLIMAFTFIVFSLLRPQVGFHWEKVTRKGVNMVVALDLSQSMLAQDVRPNRLEKAKRAIRDLVRVLQGDRIGLVAFAGVSFIQCPLTLDYDAFLSFLDICDTELIPVPGTMIGEAIRKSIEALEEGGRGGERVIVLITDGEDQGSDPLGAAHKAKERGIKIFAIGIGGRDGVPIPLQSGLKRDSRGEVILTRLDEDLLRKVASLTGGVYLNASSSGGLDLEKLYRDRIRGGNMKLERFKGGMRKRWLERYQWPLLLGIISLVAGGMI